MSLFKTWEEAVKKGALPPEWKTWEDFRAWAIANRYKVEYGYKGEFNPTGCIAVIPGIQIGIDLGSEPDKTGFVRDFNSLTRMKLDELKQLALNMGVDIGEAATKKEIANLIIEGGQG